MSGTHTSAGAPRPREFAPGKTGSPPLDARTWTAAAFAVSLVLAAVVVARFGAGQDGTAQALRVTARWCFALFWPAYAGSAVARLFGARFAVLARHGREFGLGFAAALSVHVGLVLWLMYVAADQRSLMLLFWVGVLCSYALALLSLPRLRDALGPRLWRIALELALQYIMFVFAVDFIVAPLQARGPDKYPLDYLPFAILLVGGVALRLVARMRRQSPAVKA